MVKNLTSRAYGISAELSCDECKEVVAYIQDAVKTHCELYPTLPFSVRILFGGEKRDWTGTPLQTIYEYHLDHGKKHIKAAGAAAVDVGKLRKKILCEDTRVYEYVGKDTGNKYVFCGSNGVKDNSRSIPVIHK